MSDGSRAPPAPSSARSRARSCAACGAPARPPFVAPPPELAPDLDLRPGEPTRSTLPRWIATCRTCGASAPDLAELPAGARDTVAGGTYAALKGAGPERAALRHALLCETAGDRAEAAGAVLQAAWARDDAGADATELRRRAARLWNGGDTMQDGLRVLDVLRRAGELAEADAQAARLLARPELGDTDRAVVLYQRTLVAAGDLGRHLMSSALRPPAQRPHVTHGRETAARPGPATAAPSKQAGGLWRRLFGG